ncbi:hypothetical protein N9278_01205 [bacterium]|nr:hypothetical protein [bacterium]
MKWKIGSRRPDTDPITKIGVTTHRKWISRIHTDANFPAYHFKIGAIL